MKTKNPYRLLLAALFCGVASVQAQICVFSVESLTGPSDNVQIPGVITSTNAVLDIQSTCGGSIDVYNMSQLVGSYYQISQGTGGTVHAHPASGWEYVTTTLTPTSAPGVGYTAGPDISACSGRFFVNAAEGYYDEQLESWIYTPGVPAYLYFTVGTSHSFELIVQAMDSLGGYSLTGLQNPVCEVYDVTASCSVGSSRHGENTFSLGTLSAGHTYRVKVYGRTPSTNESPYQSGIVVASVYAN